VEALLGPNVNHGAADSQPPASAWRRYWPLVLLVGLLWIVRYWHSGQFGLYEDDLTHLPTAAAMTFSQVLAYAFDPNRFLQLHGGGHPLHYTFIYLLTNLGWRIAGIHSLYWFGFAIEAINVCLFFMLLRRLNGWQLGLVAGLVYVLYSADTTQAYLTLSLGLQPAFTILLLCAHAYLSHRRWLSYLLAPLILLTYETIFPVFFAMPLLAWVRRQRRWRELVYHIAILAGILVIFAGWRFSVGDDRIGGLGIQDAIRVPLVHMVQGPIVSLGTYAYRAVQTVRGMDFEVALASVLGAALLASVLSLMDIGAAAPSWDRIRELSGGLRPSFNGWRGISQVYSRLPDQISSLVRSAVAGAAMLVLAYPLTFTVRAYAISGRDTRVHAAGLVGAAILMGSLILLSLRMADSAGRRGTASLLLGSWLGLLVGYGFVIQRDYRLAWTYQRHFWSSLVQVIPDISEGDSILVDPTGLTDTRQIGANYWNLPVVLGQIYEFPQDWHQPVWAYRLTDSWQDGIVRNDGRLSLDAATVFAPPDTFRNVDPSSAILIETENGHLTRRYAPLSLNGTDVTFKRTRERGEPSYPHGFLYQYLIMPEDSRE
jgi:hypothetical protein